MAGQTGDARDRVGGATDEAPGGRAAPRARRWGATSGIAGVVLLVGYFATPAFVAWPSAGASADQLVAYALAHTSLFYLGGWLQVTGAMLSILFFLTLLQLSGARRTLAGAVTLVGAAVLLATVVVEAALLDAVPMAAGHGDRATVATAFALANGVFARIFPLAPAPLVFAGIGAALRGSPVLPSFFGSSALVVAGLFVLAGAAAILGQPGLVFAIAMSVVQAAWIAAAAVALGRSARRLSGKPGPVPSG